MAFWELARAAPEREPQHKRAPPTRTSLLHSP
jgi:hypothetical protein